MQIGNFVDDNGFSPKLISEALRTSRAEIAETLGLGRDAFSRQERVRAVKTQMRLREMIEILNRVEAQSGSLLAAYAWFRSEQLPGFGGMTADQLVRDGHADFVHAYLDRIAAGGFA